MVDPFWNEIEEHFQSALESAGTLGNLDLRELASIPEILTYLKGLDSEDLNRLIEHARKIKKRKNLDYLPQSLDAESLPCFDYNSHPDSHSSKGGSFH